MITIEEFGEIGLRVGKVMEARRVEGSRKLLRLEVDLGDEKRVVFTGIGKWFEPEHFVDRKFIFVTGLPHKKIMEEESQAMILAAEGKDGTPVLVVPEADVEVGVRVR